MDDDSRRSAATLFVGVAIVLCGVLIATGYTYEWPAALLVMFGAMFGSKFGAAFNRLLQDWW